MITAITGRVARVLEEQVRLQVGPVEYQILVPDLVRRDVQTKIDEEVTFYTLQFLEGNPARGGRLTPRLVGFQWEPEIEFFELFCTVDGIGVRKALKAMVRPIRDVADMIERKDAQMLATLPGISTSTAERIIAKLRKKVTKFALMADSAGTKASAEQTIQASVLEDAFQALVSVGHSEEEARKRLDKIVATGKKYKNAQDVLLDVYQQA